MIMLFRREHHLNLELLTCLGFIMLTSIIVMHIAHSSVLPV